MSLTDALKELIKDVRGDVKKLIDVLASLNANISKLETFADTIARLTKELEEANRSLRDLSELVKLLKDLAK